MDTMKAFIMGETARASGNPMVYFDGLKIKKLMKKHNVREALVYLARDREYTETPVVLHGERLYGESIGVCGSVWATPMLDITGLDYEVGTTKKSRMTINFFDYCDWREFRKKKGV